MLQLKIRTIFLAIAVFWIAIVGSIFVLNEYTLRAGKVVYLKVVPVDPTDMFRGDYVNLSFNISSFKVPTSYLDSKYNNADFKSIKEGSTIYMAVDRMRSPSNEYFSDTSESNWMDVYSSPPAGKIYVKGTVLSVSPDYQANTIFRVKYGIESYFVPQHEGKSIEILKNSNMYAKVRVDRYGGALIESLQSNGVDLKY